MVIMIYGLIENLYCLKYLMFTAFGVDIKSHQ